RVDDGWTSADQRLEVVHQRHALAERLLGLFARGDIRPRAHNLKRTALVVLDDPECILDPNIMSVAVAEAVLQRPAALLNQRSHLAEYAGGVAGMKANSPEIFVFEHLPSREAHDAGDVLAHEGAGVVARLIGVDDRRRDGHEVLEPLARRL